MHPLEVAEPLHTSLDAPTNEKKTSGTRCCAHLSLSLPLYISNYTRFVDVWNVAIYKKCFFVCALSGWLEQCRAFRFYSITYGTFAI